jgi:hypothetical protein
VLQYFTSTSWNFLFGAIKKLFNKPHLHVFLALNLCQLKIFMRKSYKPMSIIYSTEFLWSFSNMLTVATMDFTMIAMHYRQGLLEISALCHKVLFSGSLTF